MNITTTKQGRAWQWSVARAGKRHAAGYCRTRKDALSDAMSVVAPELVRQAMPKVRFQRFDWNEHAGECGGWTALSLCGLYEAVAEPVGGAWRLWIVRMSDGETMFSEEVPVS